MASGSIGRHAFDWKKNAEKHIKEKVENRSAIIPNALDAIEKLKKVTGNPDSISSIGKGNYSAILKQSAQHFGSQGQNEDAILYDCDYLLSKEDAELTPEQLSAKQTCLLLEQAGEDADITAHTPLIPSNSTSNVANDPQSGLSMTLAAMSNTIDHKAWELNSNLYGNTVIGGNVSIAGVTIATGNVTLANSLTVTGNVTFGNTLTVTGNVTFANSLVVTGNVTFSNAVIFMPNLPASDPGVPGQLYIGVFGAVTVSV